MSLRTALIGGATILLLGVFAVLGALAVWSIHHGVVREAQSRVDRNLATLVSYFAEQEDQLADRVIDVARGWDLRTGQDRLRRVREDLGLTVLNARRVDEPALEIDAVVRRAFAGQATHGLVVFDEERLAREGGPALELALAVGGERRGALFWWAAAPVFGPTGTVDGVVYGGRALNHHHELVDRMRDLLFGNGRFHDKPLGTITIFLDDVRIATNVLGPDGRRAVGTRASPDVRRRVIEEGLPWRDRAWVVDTSYLSGYQPLTAADGRVVGMLYVGLLEAPYVAQKRALLLRFAAPSLAAVVLVLIAVSLVIRRLAKPLQQLSVAATQIGEGEWDKPLVADPSFSEIDALQQAFVRMQEGIRARDQTLRTNNLALADLNERLQRTNLNYMEMLGFVTHELRSPVAAMQSLADTLSAGLAGPLSEQALQITARISRNGAELQDMVRDYLALSRLERGELDLRASPTDVVEVLGDAVEQTSPLLVAQRMQLRQDAPATLTAVVDPDLLRIVLVNLLGNAAKYGAPGGAVLVTLTADEAELVIRVRNDGPGFTEAEATKLFGKFLRLRNQATRGKRGSGLGLYLCQEIARLHGGRMRAQSHPGEWAELSIELPRGAHRAAAPCSARQRPRSSEGDHHEPSETSVTD